MLTRTIPFHLKTTKNSLLRNLHYIVIAKDYPNGLEKRLAARPAHLERTKQSKATGKVLMGGATFNDQSEMNGSIMLMDAASADEIEAYLVEDPYVKGSVWKSWEIIPFKLAGISPYLK
ncbi:hypothetical protein BC833DRAFT_617945 [Globomyces pollinis-pini]|nr:hypothetical protein BC833DRAFT_617945 [Globomyces pollinis-pini]